MPANGLAATATQVPQRSKTLVCGPYRCRSSGWGWRRSYAWGAYLGCRRRIYAYARPGWGCRRPLYAYAGGGPYFRLVYAALTLRRLRPASALILGMPVSILGTAALRKRMPVGIPAGADGA